MAEQLMVTTWRTALCRQFGAAIAMLENALLACPAPLWQAHLWRDPPPPEFPPQFAEFWYVAYHALVWLDLYLSGVPEAEFAPPAPFAQGCSIPSRRCPHGLIPGRSCAPISRPRVRSATRRFSR